MPSRLLHTPVGMLVWRLVVLYAVLLLCRVVFYLYNAQLIGPIPGSEVMTLLAGALKFDTASVVYADGIFILLALLPLRLRQRRWYRRLMFGYYVVVNSLLVWPRTSPIRSTSATRRNGLRPTRSSSPTTTTRCSWSASSWPKTGIWSWYGSC